MGTEHSKAMVLRDAQGNYYVLPLDVVERARVPAERQAELEAALGGGEVAGYSMVGAVRPFTVERAMRQGLFTSHGYLHHHQRELLEGAYAHEHVARFGGIIARWGEWQRDRWQA